MRRIVGIALVVGVSAGCGEVFEATGGDSGTSPGSGGSVGGGGSAGGSTDSINAGGTGGTCGDADGDSDADGFDACSGDCNDTNPTVFPGAPEVCDGVDSDCAGDGDPVLCKGVYVSVMTGNQANPGTADKPVKTIAMGLQIASAIATKGHVVQVFVARGDYEEGVTLAADVSLRGDCSLPDWACGTTRQSRIYGQGEVAMSAGPSITAATVVEGFTIYGVEQPATGSSIALDIDGGGPVVRGNQLIAGMVNGDLKGSVGVLIHTLSATTNVPTLENNDIRASDAQYASFGVEMLSPGIGATLVGNRISGATALLSGGVGVFDAGKTLLHNNRIQSGAGTLGKFVANQPGFSWGVLVRKGEVEIDGNTINPNNASDAPGSDGAIATCLGPVGCGGVWITSSAVKVWNNIVYGANADSALGISVVETMELGGGAENVLVHSNYVDPLGRPMMLGQPEADTVSACFLIFTDFDDESRPVGRFRDNICTGGTNEKRYALYEAETGAAGTNPEPKVFTNNDLYLVGLNLGAAFFYRDVSKNGVSEYSTLDPNVMPHGEKNLAIPPLFVGGKLQPSSLCVNKGVPDDGPDHDIDNEPRPKGANYDIGPDEVK